MEGNVSFTQSINQIYFLNSLTQWMCMTVPPFIVAFGTFGNVMTLVVLRRIGFGTTNLFLRALAISDLLLLYFGLFDGWLNLTFNITLAILHDSTCKLNTFLYYSTGVLSAWLIVAMTVQRALSVVWPHRIHIMCNRRKALSLIMGVLSFVVILNAHFLYGMGLKIFSNSTAPICEYLTADYQTFLSVIWSWVDLLSFSLLPFVLLVISNSVLIWKLKTSVKNVTLIAGHSDNSGVREKRTSSITVTLIAVSLTFLALALPNSLVLIITPYVNAERFKNDLEVRAITHFTYFLCTFLWYANSAVNFYIYCLTGNKFRAEIKSFICGLQLPFMLMETMMLRNSGTSSFTNTQSTSNVRGEIEEF